MDEAKPGIGTVCLDDADPCLIVGDDTRFTEQFAPRAQIMLPKSLGSVVAEVVEVISDTRMRIKREFGGDSGKVTPRVREKVDEARQAGKQGIEFKCLPFINQQDMYRNVYQCLKEGGCIGIFPEGSYTYKSVLRAYSFLIPSLTGGSHDRSDLLPLKAGVSVMALGAMADDPNVKVKIVPVGLSYFHPHKFRSRAVVEFGSALDVPPELVEMFKEGGTKKRDAVSKFLEIIYNSLKTVTIRAPDYDTLMVSPLGIGHRRRLISGYSLGHPSRSAPLRNTRAAPDPRASRGAEQAFPRRIQPFQRRATHCRTPGQRPQVQSPCLQPGSA